MAKTTAVEIVNVDEAAAEQAFEERFYGGGELPEGFAMAEISEGGTATLQNIEYDPEGGTLQLVRSLLAEISGTLDDLRDVSSPRIRRATYRELPLMANDLNKAIRELGRLGMPEAVPTDEGTPKRRGRPRKNPE